jgi:hypothetical protein
MVWPPFGNADTYLGRLEPQKSSSMYSEDREKAAVIGPIWPRFKERPQVSHHDTQRDKNPDGP